ELVSDRRLGLGWSTVSEGRRNQTGLRATRPAGGHAPPATPATIPSQRHLSPPGRAPEYPHPSRQGSQREHSLGLRCQPERRQSELSSSSASFLECGDSSPLSIPAPYIPPHPAYQSRTGHILPRRSVSTLPIIVTTATPYRLLHPWQARLRLATGAILSPEAPVRSSKHYPEGWNSKSSKAV